MTASSGCRGQNEVALITGEEKIVPKVPRFYVCTVEAMPLDIPVACLVIDEIQLCADPERGHVFTDRLLQCARRGRDHAPGQRHHARHHPALHSQGLVHHPAALFRPGLYRRQETHPPAPPLRRGRLLRRRCLWHRRSDPPPARRRRGGAGRAVARAPAMPRSRSINRAMWISWSPPTPSAWG